jgi:hypothetical protein
MSNHPSCRTLAFSVLFVATTAMAQADRPAAPESGDRYYLAAVNQDDIYVRSGPADSYYPFGRIKAGDIVKVIGEKYDWARVVTVGPAFDEFFGYLRDPKDQTNRVRVEAGGKRCRTLGRVDLLAPNLNTKYNPRDSWKRILLLEADVALTLLEPPSDTELEVVYKVALPPKAEGWISVAFLEPATADQTAAWLAAVEPPSDGSGRPAAGGERRPSREDVLAREEPVLPPVRTPPPAPGQTGQVAPVPGTGPGPAAADRAVIDATTPADRSAATGDLPAAATGEEMAAISPQATAASRARAEAEAKLEALEEMYRQLRREPIETAEVLPLRQLYLNLADETIEHEAVSIYAMSRAEQLAIWADLQERRAEISRLRKRLRMTVEEAEAVRLALESRRDYVAVGRLTVSTIYDGRRLPALYRLQDAGTGRTIAYLRPTEAFNLGAMIGQIVGIVGEKGYDGGLRLNLVDPARIDLLAPRSEDET